MDVCLLLDSVPPSLQCFCFWDCTFCHNYFELPMPLKCFFSFLLFNEQDMRRLDHFMCCVIGLARLYLDRYPQRTSQKRLLTTKIDRWESSSSKSLLYVTFRHKRSFK